MNIFRTRKAIQFDFYFPKAIWKNRDVQRFYKLLSRHVGATVFNDETGVWHGSKEITQVLRVIIPSQTGELKKFRNLLQTELSKLILVLEQSKSHQQETIMFTEASITQVLTQAR